MVSGYRRTHRYYRYGFFYNHDMKKKNVFVFVLFLPVGAHGPLQSNERRIKTLFPSTLLLLLMLMREQTKPLMPVLSIRKSTQEKLVVNACPSDGLAVYCTERMYCCCC